MNLFALGGEEFEFGKVGERLGLVDRVDGVGSFARFELGGFAEDSIVRYRWIGMLVVVTHSEVITVGKNVYKPMGNDLAVLDEDENVVEFVSFSLDDCGDFVSRLD